MADTVRVEVDIRAKDNTAAGVSSAERRINSFERSMTRAEKQLARMEGRHNIAVDVNDTATDKLSSIENALNEAAGTEAKIDLEANDMATDVIQSAADAAQELNSMEAEADLEANDMATDTIQSAEQEVDTFDGMSGEADLEANDMATDVVQSAEQEVDTFSGMSGNATIGANDEASSIIDGATVKAQAWADSAFTATIGVLGVTAGVVDTVNTYKDFQLTMSEVGAISEATHEEILSLTESAKQYGATTKFTATESAEAFKYMAEAGWKVSEMQDGIGGIINLAAATGEDIGTTSDIVTDALTAFNYQASDSAHFADVLAKSASSSNTDVSKMGETFKYVGSMAGALGYSIEDVGIAAGLMANAGVKSSMSGTALNQIFTRLSTNTNGARDAISALGIEFYNTDGSARDWLDVMTELRTATADYTDEQKANLANTVAGTSAQKGLLAILNATDDSYNGLVTSIYNADGAAQSMADTMMDNLYGSITLFQSALEGVKNTIGERAEPYLRTAIDALTEQLPDASEKINAFMNSFDMSVERMTASEAWKNADMFGKLDIAFDELIGTPFKEWISSDGVSLISSGINDLFGNAMKILPGGQKATLTSWLSAGLLGIGTSKLIGGAKSVVPVLTSISSAISGISSAATNAGSIGEFVTNLSGIASPAGLAVAGIAATTAAVIAVTSAVAAYNEEVKQASLEENFGHISLSDTQAQDLADGILNQKYLVNVDYALGEARNVEQFRQDAEDALDANKPLEFKGSVGVELTADEQNAYTSNIKTFIDAKIKEIETLPWTATIHAETYLGGTEEGETLEQSIKEWARADNLKLTNLSNDLSAAVEDALVDGIIDVDEQAAISALQEKINNITARWNEAEQQAELDWIQQEYGHLSAADLDSGSFTKLMSALHERQETGAAKVQEDVTNWYAELNAMMGAGRITPEQNRRYHELTKSYVKGQNGNELKTILDLGTNTLSDTYGDLITENTERINSLGGGTTMQNLNEWAEQGDIGSMLDGYTFSRNRDFMSKNGGADRKALLSMYEEMKPDVESMGSLIDDYIAAGEKVPQALMDSFNNAIETGAAAGDSDAAWQNYANSIKESGNDALIDMLTNPNNEMYETIQQQLPEELKTALNRAFAETTDEEVTLDGLRTSVDGEVDLDKDAWLKSLNEKLGDLATAEEVTADGATIKVEAGQCLWQIGEALGVDWHTIAEENGIEEPYTIYPGDELTISFDSMNAEVDADAASAAIDDAMSALTAEGAEFSVTADGVTVDLADVTVDSDTASAQIEAALGMESGTLAGNGIDVTTGATVTVPADLVNVDTSGIEGAISNATAENTETDPISTTADVTATAGEINTSDARAQAESEITSVMGEEYPADANTDVTLTETNNVDQIYAQCDGEVKAKFASGFNAHAPVRITLDYTIVNPSASITLGGGASGSGSVTATVTQHAQGGRIDDFTISSLAEEGTEYVIPTTGRYKQRGLDLWYAAGEELGAFDNMFDNADDGVLTTPFDSKDSNNIWTNGGSSDTSTDYTIPLSEPSSSTSNSTGDSSKNVTVNVNLAPTIKIEGDNLDAQKIFAVVQERIRELADDIGDEIAEKMEQAFGNMPLAEGA